MADKNIIPTYSVIDYLQSLLIAVMATGVGHATKTPEGDLKFPSKASILLAILCAWFIAWMGLFLCESLGISGAVAGLLIGVSAYGGPTFFIELVNRSPGIRQSIGEVPATPAAGEDKKEEKKEETK